LRAPADYKVLSKVTNLASTSDLTMTTYADRVTKSKAKQMFNSIYYMNGQQFMIVYSKINYYSLLILCYFQVNSF